VRHQESEGGGVDGGEGDSEQHGEGCDERGGVREGERGGEDGGEREGGALEGGVGNFKHQPGGEGAAAGQSAEQQDEGVLAEDEGCLAVAEGVGW